MKARIALVAAVPLVTGVLLAWHPPDPTDVMTLVPVLPRWLTVHLGLLVALPLLALLLLRLLGDVRSLPATVSRVAVVVATALYTAFETLLGTGTGILVGLADPLPAELRAGAVELAQRWWEVPPLVALLSALAIIAWVLAYASAAVALHRDGAAAAVVWGLLLAATVFAAGHPGITGLVAMLALAVAFVAGERDRAHGDVLDTRDRSSWGRRSRRRGQEVSR
jgi:hypothetical protein